MRLHPTIQKLYDRAESAERSARKRRAEASATPAHHVPHFHRAHHAAAGLSHPTLPADHPFNRPHKAGKRKKAKRAQAAAPHPAHHRTTRKLHAPGLPPDHPFNRPRKGGKRKAKQAKKTGKGKKAKKRGSSKRKARKAQPSPKPPRSKLGAHRHGHKLTESQRELAYRAAMLQEREARQDMLDAEGMGGAVQKAAERHYAKALANVDRFAPSSSVR